MKDIITFIVGFFAGIGTNLLSWWVLAHYFVPKVEFGPSISKMSNSGDENDKSGYRYRVKFHNEGRRNIIDLVMRATLYVDGLKYGTTTELIGIPWGTDGHKEAHILYLEPVKPGIRTSRILRLHVNANESFCTGWYFPEEFKTKAREKELLLEDLLRLGNKAWIRLTAFGYDEFSGARKLFVSKNYTVNDIKTGKFRIGGLDVIEQRTEITDEQRNNDNGGA